MAKKLIQDYVFLPEDSKIILKGAWTVQRLLLISNIDAGKVLFAVGSPSLNISNRTLVEDSPYFADGVNKFNHTEFVLTASMTGMTDEDEIQVFMEEDSVSIEPSETLMDPVHKLRVSTPQTLIDTDFEYGLQATKWETLETINNVPAFFIKNGETSLGDITSVNATAGSSIVTVTTVAAHGLSPGAPFEIRGLQSITAEGTYLVKAVPTSNTFTYEAKSPQVSSEVLNSSYTVIFPGQFYTASNISLDQTQTAIVTDGVSNASKLTVNTRFPHGFSLSSVNPVNFYLINSVAGRSFVFNPTTTAADGRPVVDFEDTFAVSQEFVSTGTGGGGGIGAAGSAVSGLSATPQMTGYRTVEAQNWEPANSLSVPASQIGVTDRTALQFKPPGYAATEHYVKTLYIDFAPTNGSQRDIIAGVYSNNGTIQAGQGYIRYNNHGFNENDVVLINVGPNPQQAIPVVGANAISNNTMFFVRKIDDNNFTLKQFVDARTTVTIPGTATSRSTIIQTPHPVKITRVGTTSVAVLYGFHTTTNAITITTPPSGNPFAGDPVWSGANNSAALPLSLGYGDYNNNNFNEGAPTAESVLSGVSSGATYTITEGMYVAGDQNAIAAHGGIPALQRVTVAAEGATTITCSANFTVASGNAGAPRPYYFYRIMGLPMFLESTSDTKTDSSRINRLNYTNERYVMNNHYLADNTRVMLMLLPANAAAGTAQRLNTAIAGVAPTGLGAVDANNNAAIALAADTPPVAGAATRQQYPMYVYRPINGSNVYYVRRIGSQENNSPIDGKNLNIGLSQFPNGPILSIEGSVTGNYLLLPITDNPRADQIYIPAHGFADDYLLQYNQVNGLTATQKIDAVLPATPDVSSGFVLGTSYYVKRIDANYIRLKTTVSDATLLNIINSGAQTTTTTRRHRFFNAAQDNVSKNTIFISNHGLSNNNPIQYNTSTAEIGGLDSGNTYYAQAYNNNRIRLSAASGATPINLTSIGSGTAHEIVDQSSVGSIDGVYRYNVAGANSSQMRFNTTGTITGRKISFDPTRSVDCFNDLFTIDNHGFSTATTVTYVNPNGSNDILPLSSGTSYKVVRVTNNAFSLTDTSGVPIVLQSPGSSISPALNHRFESTAVSGEVTGAGIINLSYSSKEFDSSTSAVVDIINDSFTLTAHGYFAAGAGTAVRYDNSGGTNIGGLTNGQIYYIGYALKKPGRTDANDFSLYRTPNGAIGFNRNDIVDLTSLGSGTHKFLTGSTVVNLLTTGVTIPTFQGTWTARAYNYGDVVQFRGKTFIAQKYAASQGAPVATLSTDLPLDYSAGTYFQNYAWKRIHVPLGPEPKFLQSFKVGDGITIFQDHQVQNVSASPFACNGTNIDVATNRFIAGHANHGLVTGEAITFYPTSAAVASVTVTAVGGGYTTHPTVTMSAPPDNSGGTTATATVRTRLQYIKIIDGGAGYTGAPTLTFARGAGDTTSTLPAATAIVDGGQVVGFTITNEGLNILAAGTVTASLGGGTTQATLQCVYKVQDVVLVGGGTVYEEEPIVTFAPPQEIGGGTYPNGDSIPLGVTATGVSILNTPTVAGGATLGTRQVYYARPINANQFEIYDSKANAETSTSVIDLLATGAAAGCVWKRNFRAMRFDPTVTTTPAATQYPEPGVAAMQYATFRIQFPGIHSMATGDAVIYNQNFNALPLEFLDYETGTALPLTNYATYYVRAVDTRTITLHTSEANALNNTLPIRIQQGSITGAQTHFFLHKIYQKPFRTTVTGITTNSNLFLRELPTTQLINCEYAIPTSIYIRPDAYTLHRPFDGGVEMTTGYQANAKIVRQTRRYFRYQSGKGIQTSIALNFNPNIEIDTLTSDGTTAYATTKKQPHGLSSTVSSIKVSGVMKDDGITLDPHYNGTFSVTVTGENTFTYTMTDTPDSATAYGYPVGSVVKGQNWGSNVKVGMFDDQNGMFFKYDGVNISCVRRSSTQQIAGSVSTEKGSSRITGFNTFFLKQLGQGQTVVIRGQTYKITEITNDTEMFISPEYRGSSKTRVVVTTVQDFEVPQSLWNIDKCLGDGPTGFKLDIDKIQMAYIDYSWYGAGKIRFGFKDDSGKIRYIHEFKHNNFLYESYLRSGNLPARYEVECGNNPAYVPSLFHWGTSVIMDGRFDDDKAYLFTVGSDDLSIPTTSALQNIPLISLRLAPSVDSSLTGQLGDRDIVNRMQITPDQLSVLSTVQAQVFVVLNANLTAPNFSTLGIPSLAQIIKHSGVPVSDGYTGGVVVFETRVQANQSATIDLTKLSTLGNSIMGGDEVYPNGPDTLTVVVRYRTLAAAAGLTASLTWTESQA
jgi:hypothetical protein